MKVNGIYYLNKTEMEKITQMEGKEKDKWAKREIRNIDDCWVKKNKGIGGSRADRRRKKFKTLWRDGNQKDFYDHKTKKVLTRTQLISKRKLQRNIK